ncbi:hypothetical protein, partial [Thermococcus sp. GR4]
LSLLSAVLLIAFVFLLRGINDFQAFDFFGKLPLNLSGIYLRKNAHVLNCLFINNTFRSIAGIEFALFGFGLFKFLHNGPYIVRYLIYNILLSLFIGYMFVVPASIINEIELLIETFSYKIVFDKWFNFNELGQVVLNVLSSSLIISAGFALFVFIIEKEALVAIGIGLFLSLLTGFIGIHLLLTHHRNIKRAKL